MTPAEELVADLSPAPREWLIADGLGGYAMGTADGIRTRRYHSLLLVAAPDSERRFVLVNSVEAVLETARGPVRLSAQRYAPDVVHAAAQATAYSPFPWPRWEFDDATHEVSGVPGAATTVLTWRLKGKDRARLRVRLLLSGRDWHALHRENPAFRFACQATDRQAWRFRPYDGVPPVTVFANATYAHAPVWYRQFQYDEECARGQDFIEDLGSPGEFTFDLAPESPNAVLMLSTALEWGGSETVGDVVSGVEALRAHERERPAASGKALELMAEPYLVTRGKRRTIIAGYPWFTDWGRDTFVSVRGLCIATGRLSDAEAILLSWCEHLSEGMMPNLFPAGVGKPEYNSVDAALWFIIAVRDLSVAVSGRQAPQVPLRFITACEEILSNYARGTRHGIKMDSDGLLSAGAPGMALTWMDAIVDGRPVTPRIGKPVEVQALWVNALEFAGSWNTRWSALAARAHESFGKRFWNEKRGWLNDVVDVDHVAGTADDRLRPNQVFACGGLPSRLVEGARAIKVVSRLLRTLDTPQGLRSLSPDDPSYVGRVDGPMRQRDLGYHQGTVWPWLSFALMDAFRRAWKDVTAPDEASELMALMAARPGGSVGSGEIADGDPPHIARGCPFQAWTVAEQIRTFSPPAES